MVYDRIKQLREQRGFTQAELAKMLGVTRSCVNAWEMGVSVPSTQSLVQLAEIFDISTDYILGVGIAVAPIASLFEGGGTAHSAVTEGVTPSVSLRSTAPSEREPQRRECRKGLGPIIFPDNQGTPSHR